MLNKGEFRDALKMRYGLHIEGLPSRCGCGMQNSFGHAMTCSKGYRCLFHNEVRDLLTVLCKDAGFKDVEKEPGLQPLQGECLSFFREAKIEDEAHPDLRVRSFWRSWRNTYFDVTTFSPFAPSYENMSLPSLFKQAERRKIRAFSERILHVEHGDFTPFVVSVSGGLGHQAAETIKRIVARLAERQDLPRSLVMGRVRIRLSFAILRSTLVMLRGSRAFRPNEGESIERAVAASRADTVEADDCSGL